MGNYAVLVVVALAGCIRTNPARGISPADGPARVKIVHTSDVYIDYMGNRRRNVTTDWQYQQGSEPVDEQDWWKLTDPRISDEIKRAREGVIRRQRIGRALMVGGYASLALVPVGLVVGGGGGKAMAITGGVVGFVASTLGHILYSLNSGHESHHMTIGRAKAAADEIEECHDERCRVDTKRR